MAMRRDRITPRQLFWLIATLILGLHIAQAPRLTVEAARQDFWLAEAVAVAVVLLVAVILQLLASRFPGRSLFQYSVDILGPAWGRAVALLFVWFFIHVAALALRQVSDFYLMVLPETPLVVFVAILAMLSSYGAYLGRGAIARANELLSPTVFAVAGLVAVAAISIADPYNLLPLLPFGPGRALAAAPLTAAWLGVCLIAGIFAADLRPSVQLFRINAWAVVFSASGATLLTLEAVAALGQGLAGQKPFPVLFMLRLLRFGQFLERLELIFYLFGTAATVLIIVAMHDAAACGLAQTLGGLDPRPLAAPLGLLIAALAMGLLPSRLGYEEFMADGFPLYALSLEVGLPMLLLAAALIRGRRRPRQRVQ